MCALWHFRLVDRALDRLGAGAERRAANPGRRCWPTARPAAVFCLGLGDRRWRSSRQPPLAAAGRRAAFGCTRTLLDFGIGRARPLLESARKRWPRFPFAPRFLVRARAAPRPAVSIRRRRRAAMGTVRREPIETAGRGVTAACVRSGISGWLIGLLIGRRAVAERRAANPGRRCWPTARPAAVFCLGLGDRRWRSSSANPPLAAAAGQPSDVRALCWILASAERDRSLNLARKTSRVFLLRPVSSCARGRRLGQRFRSGGAGAQLWGLFGASRSKPLAEGWLRRVCALAFQAG